MFKFKRMLQEVAQPKAEDELNFKEKHIIQHILDPEAEEDQFTADGIKKFKNRADYKPGEDIDVYESSDSDCKTCDRSLDDCTCDRAKAAEIYRKIIETSSYLKKYINSKIVSESIHTVDWDGLSQVKLMHMSPTHIIVNRIDKSGKAIQDDEHTMYYYPHEPEYKQIKREAAADDDAEAWREKRAASREGRHYHESVEQIDELNKDTLKSYVKQAAKQADVILKHSIEDQPRSVQKASAEALLRRQRGLKDAGNRLGRFEMSKLKENLEEAFTPGILKLNDGNAVTLSAKDTSLLNKMFADLNSVNRTKMQKVLMSDKHGFEEILGFAKEAL